MTSLTDVRKSEERLVSDWSRLLSETGVGFSEVEVAGVTDAAPTLTHL